MKKIFGLIITICLFMTINSVQAATVTSTSYSNGKITVSGTGTSDVQIVLFDLDNKPMYLATTSTTNGKFTYVLPSNFNLSKGNYTVKVAEYNGTGVASSTLKVEPIKVTTTTKSTTTTNNITTAKNATANPNTYDNIINYIILGIIALTGLTGIIMYTKKHKAKN